MDYVNACREIRGLMKQQGVGYEALSKRISVPVSTLKKQLTAEDGSLNRLNRICQGLGFGLVDVLSSESERPAESFRFTPKQVQLFQRSRQTFEIYWRLVFERWSEERLRCESGLSKRTISKALVDLDRVDLIRVSEDGKIRVPAVRYISWNADDEFSMGLRREWGVNLLMDGLAREQATLQHYQLTEESRDELLTRVKELEREFARRTIRELKLYPDKVSSMRSLSVLAEGSFLRKADSDI